MNMLNKYEVTTIRQRFPKQSPLIEFGDLEFVTSSGRAICKACGQKITKGQPAAKFMWDFTGSGRWTAQEIQIHKDSSQCAV